MKGIILALGLAVSVVSASSAMAQETTTARHFSGGWIERGLDGRFVKDTFRWTRDHVPDGVEKWVTKGKPLARLAVRRAGWIGVVITAAETINDFYPVDELAVGAGEAVYDAVGAAGEYAADAIEVAGDAARSAYFSMTETVEGYAVSAAGVVKEAVYFTYSATVDFVFGSQ